MNRQRGRAYRIRKKQLKKQEAFKRAKENGWSTSPKGIGLMATTPTPCSAECCGNVRKHSGNSKCGKTQQVLQSNEYFKAELNDTSIECNLTPDTE